MGSTKCDTAVVAQAMNWNSSILGILARYEDRSNENLGLGIIGASLECCKYVAHLPESRSARDEFIAELTKR